MKNWKTGVLILVLAGVMHAQQAAAPESASAAKSQDAMEQRLRDLEDRMVMLEGQLRQLKAQGAQPATPSPAAPGGQPPAVAAAPPPATVEPQDNVRLGGAGVSAAKALNPDISVIGDFIGTGGPNPTNPSQSLQMHESEVALPAIVDPYPL